MIVQRPILPADSLKVLRGLFEVRADLLAIGVKFRLNRLGFASLTPADSEPVAEGDTTTSELRLGLTLCTDRTCRPAGDNRS